MNKNEVKEVKDEVKEVKDVLSNNNKPISNELKSKIVYGNVNVTDTYYFRGDESNLTIFKIDEIDMHKTGGIYFTKKYKLCAQLCKGNEIRF